MSLVPLRRTKRGAVPFTGNRRGFRCDAVRPKNPQLPSGQQTGSNSVTSDLPVTIAKGEKREQLHLQLADYPII